MTGFIKIKITRRAMIFGASILMGAKAFAQSSPAAGPNSLTGGGVTASPTIPFLKPPYTIWGASGGGGGGAAIISEASVALISEGGVAMISET